MLRKIWIGFVACFFPQSPFAQTRPLPVIDMHLHALHADDQGPPPINLGAPFPDLGLRDPKDDYRNVFMTALKTKMWADASLTSPTTDDSLKKMTVAALKRNNVYAVTSGDIETVRGRKRTAPDRIINSIYWDFDMARKRGKEHFPF